jgi:chromosome segregation ATPase
MPTQTDASDARQRMLDIKRQLEEAVAQITSLQSGLTAQGELEQLLKQGRVHLQDLRNRVQQVSAERDKLQAEIVDAKRSHQSQIDQLNREMDDVRQELHSAAAERDRVAVQLSEQEAAHQRFAEERADERSTFKRLLDEASSNQREMMQELNEQREQLDTLREAAMRAQSFAREIMRAHEAATASAPKPPHD